jgi:hypothetical protein
MSPASVSPNHDVVRNFIRSHQTIRCTPGMAAEVTDRLWTMADVVELIESRECDVSVPTSAVTAN